jgi:menaquinone-specific isochorismate synthase
LDSNIDPVRIGAGEMLWIDKDLILAGFGEAARFVVDRTNGTVGAAAAQKRLSCINCTNETGDTSSGPAAFATFPFDPKAPGELIIPKILLRQRPDGDTWLTITGDGSLSIEEAIEEVLSLPTREENSPPTRVEVESIIPPDEWRDDIIAKAVEHILAGDLEKVVLARELMVTMDRDIGIPQIIESLISTHPNAMIFSIDNFVGASPELLVSRAGDVVQAHPLAGTTARLVDKEEDRSSIATLLDSTKDHSEHAITIKWLLNELLPFCSYVDADPEPNIVSLPNVHHLGTRVHGQLSHPAASVLELVAVLHPTPAVAGEPQHAAIALIDEIERAERGKYAGPVGWVDSDGNGAFAVGIRSAQIKKTEARLFAGVGIVADSDPQLELDETDLKFQTMLSAILSLME